MPQLPELDEQVLTDWLVQQRWFGAKTASLAHLGMLTAVPLRASEEPPLLAAALLEARFPAGTHELYQVLLGARPVSEGWTKGVIGEAGGWTLYDALADPEETAVLGDLLADGAEITGDTGVVRFYHEGGERPSGRVRAMGAEQSNSSIVFGDRQVLKVFRRLEAGENPELEMLRFLQTHGFRNIAPLEGWYQYNGQLMDATLGVLQAFVGGARDGWELALEEIAEPRLLERLARLGGVTAQMHNALASDGADPDFAPEDPGDEGLSLLVATIDEQIERIFMDLPENDERVGDIAGRGDEIRDRLQMLSHVGVGGRLIRHHGDYHLGQTLLSRDGDWVILDFEGEPARPLLERRRKRSPLRDVAGMLRSFAYVASASDLQRGTPAPEGWEGAARDGFLSAYFDAIEPTLLPAGQAATDKLLQIFELEKAVYELRYELNNRPDWVGIPVRGIRRLLEEPMG
jgi:trehalose synthase-fused probable maltokinase